MASKSFVAPKSSAAKPGWIVSIIVVAQCGWFVLRLIQPGVPGGAKGALLCYKTCCQTGTSRNPSSLGQGAGRHHTKKRYPPEQASGAGKPTRSLFGTSQPHQATHCHAARRAAPNSMFIPAPKINPAFSASSA